MTIPIVIREDDYWSETEQVHVENRGAAFGKITVWNEDIAVAQFTWHGNGTIRPIGLGEPPRAYKERAVRALAETSWGAKALRTDQRTPEFIAASRRHHIGNPHNINPAGDTHMTDTRTPLMQAIMLHLAEVHPHLTSDDRYRVAQHAVRTLDTGPDMGSAAPEPTEMDPDDMANCMIVTGAVWAALMNIPGCTLVHPEGNTLRIGLSFMKSEYVVTVTRAKDDF